MTGRVSLLLVAGQIAIRNLAVSRTKTLIVGGIVTVGAFLTLVGSSLLHAVDESMTRSIVGSVAGDLQVYSSESETDLALLGGMALDSEQTAPLQDFEPVRKALSEIPNVAQVVPMGIDNATVFSGNTLDLLVAKLRDAVRAELPSHGPWVPSASVQARIAQVRHAVEVLGTDAGRARLLRADSSELRREEELLERVSSDSYWKDFLTDPMNSLETLENRVAPLLGDAGVLYLRYVGTDPGAFSRGFDRMKIVDGQAIPEGHRGFLFSKYVYEEQVKLPVARALDKIHRAKVKRGRSLATDPELSAHAQLVRGQVQSVLLQLDPRQASALTNELSTALEKPGQLPELLGEFLSLTDDNFDSRYEFFYSTIAPMLDLYSVKIGDTLTLKGFTSGGYIRSASVKVYGTYAFEGLEDSPQAGSLNIMDLVTFRNLYGFMTDQRRQEIDRLRASAAVEPIDKNLAEQALFAGGSPEDVSKDTSPGTNDLPSTSAGEIDLALANLEAGEASNAESTTIGPQELSRGVFLNAAVLLDDPSRAEETRAAIEGAGKAIGLPLRAVSWQQATGFIGQFASFARLTLVGGLAILFLVALVIMSNALVMATLQRVNEFGTLRALGAQRTTVFAMVVVESLVVGGVFGGLGASLGIVLLVVIGQTGIPATTDMMTFFFSGDRLFPNCEAAGVTQALCVVLCVSLVSGLYPALLAMRVSPALAMAGKD